MRDHTKTLDLELTQPLKNVSELSGYARAHFLLRWHGQPVGWVKMSVHSDSCSATEIAQAIIEQHNIGFWKPILRNALLSTPAGEWNSESLLKLSAPTRENLPTISVAVCTRDRTKSLAQCLCALEKLKYAPLEILVIDNAPTTSGTLELVEKCFPHVRYVLEPRTGLDWARNRAIAEARGEIVAFTDDDVIVDTLWTKALAETFAESEDVMAVTGLVVPFELESEAQVLFEEYGGFGRGFERKWYRASQSERQHLAGDHAGSGKFGTGANMAFRRKLFSEIGAFDPALDVGTATQGGGDLDMFFRVLKHGHTLVYEPAAIVRHCHRREMRKLRAQITSNGIGFYSHLVRNALSFPEERRGIFKLGLWWLWWWNVRRLLQSLFKPTVVPRQIIAAELRGSFVGLTRYQKAKRKIKEITDKFGPLLLAIEDSFERSPTLKALRYGTAVRTMELTHGITDLAAVTEYFRTRIYLTWNGAAIGQMEISNRYRPIPRGRLADEIVNHLSLKLLKPTAREKTETLWAESVSQLRNFLRVPQTEVAEPLTPVMPISIVIATYDRPDDLRNCLISLSAQQTTRPVEIIVVDNNPASGQTPPVVAEFPNVKIVNETRGGLSYARNTGFTASTGEILICVDDDVAAPPDWLENVLAPFARNDVMLVTGNVFPIELETASQLQFENYGGLGRGFDRREFDRKWFDSFSRKAVPTWEIGATANAAVRASMLHDPAVGLLDEALGAGSPTGCSEDTYLFYRVLKAGYKIVYEPGAYVWHKHRTDDRSLCRQIYSYSKGHAAYHLLTFLRDGDCRGLFRLFGELPRYHLKQIFSWLRGSRDRSLQIILLEIAGNLAGPFALWKSRRRVKRFGYSLPYLPVDLRLMAENLVEGISSLRWPRQTGTL